MALNRVIITGNITREPELRYTPKGTAVLKIGVAINRTWKNEAGEKQEAVTFVDATAWGRTGEVIAEYFKKGDPILIEGRLDLESWIDKATQEKRSKLCVTVESFEFINGRAAGKQPDGAGNEAADAAADAEGH